MTLRFGAGRRVGLCRVRTLTLLVELGANFQHLSKDGENALDKAKRSTSIKCTVLLAQRASAPLCWCWALACGEECLCAAVLAITWVVGMSRVCF